MVTQLQPDVRAYLHGGEVIKRYIRVEEVAHEYGFSVEETEYIAMITAQRPPEKSTLMADYDTWKKVGRYVKRGAKGCAIFPSRALNPRIPAFSHNP